MLRELKALTPGGGIAIVALGGLLSLTANAQKLPAQDTDHGSIRGTVTIDAGKLIGMRIKAYSPDGGMTYNVFTRNGKYRVPYLYPGTYEVWVSQRGYESAKQEVEVKAGEVTTLDLTATVKEGFDVAEQFRPREPHTRMINEDAELVSFDELYPPGAGRDALMDHCFACHGTMFHHMTGLDRGSWDYLMTSMVNRLSIEGARKANIIYTIEHFPQEDYDAILNYLSENFGPDDEYRDLKLNELVPNEDMIADAVFIEYDVPVPKADSFGPRSYHDPYISPNGDVWFNDRANRSAVQIDPDAPSAENRIVREYQSPWETTSMHGIAVDSQNRVYITDINGGYLLEVDAETGEWTRYETTGNMEPPWNVPPGTRTSESMNQIALDSDENVWGGLVSGNKIFRFDPETKDIKAWPLPTPDTNPYGLILASDDTLWSAGISADKIIAFDTDTETFTEYETPTQPSAPRRLTEGQDGNIWWAEYVGGHIGMVDPETGEMTEYDYPLEFTRGYDAWAVGDYIWMTEATYQTLVRFDPETKEFVYYPLPMIQPSPNPGVPKLEYEKDGTIWFAYRGLRDRPNPVVAFYPRGNAGPWDGPIEDANR